MNIQALIALFKRPANWLAIGIFAIALGAVSVMFSALDTMLYRPLNVKNADRLVSLFDMYPEWGGGGSISIGTLIERKNEIPELENAALYRGIAANLITDASDPAARAVRLNGMLVSASFFDTVGLRPKLGRAFTELDVAAPNQLVVISDAIWKKHFNADPKIIGQSIRLQGEAREVIGVMGPDQIMQDPNISDDFYFGLHIKAQDLSPDAREYNHWRAIGLMRQGVSREQIAAKSTALFERYAKSRGETRYRQFVDERQYSDAEKYRQTIFGSGLARASLLLYALLGVLAIACANIANLLSTQVVERSREFAVRAALGAPRGALMRALLIEGALIAFVGALLGLGFAYLLHARAAELLLGSTLIDAALSWRVMLLMSVIGVMSGLLASLLSAWLAMRQPLHQGLRSGGRSVSASGDLARLRSYLSAFQIGLAFAILAGALALVRDFQSLDNGANGFNPRDVHTMRFSLTGERYADNGVQARALEDLRSKLVSLPNVAAVSLSQHLPFNGDSWGASFSSAKTVKDVNLRMVLVGPGFFDTLRIPLKAGRDFGFTDLPSMDSSSSTPSKFAIVDEQAAMMLFGDTDVIGKTIVREDGNLLVVGLAGDVQRNDPGTASAQGSVYFPLSQVGGTGEIQIALRMHPGMRPPIDQVRLRLSELDRGLALFDVRTLDSMRVNLLQPARQLSNISSSVSLFALLLAAIGTFGVLAFAISARRMELAVRQAVGASPVRLIYLVLADTARLLILGIVIGLPIWIGVQLLIRAELQLIPAFEPQSALMAIAAIALAGLLACALPAWRAIRTQPVLAMRSE